MKVVEINKIKGNNIQEYMKPYTEGHEVTVQGVTGSFSLCFLLFTSESCDSWGHTRAFFTNMVLESFPLIRCSVAGTWRTKSVYFQP